MARPAPDLLARPAVCGRPTGMILTRAPSRAPFTPAVKITPGPQTCSRAPVGSPASTLRFDHRLARTYRHIDARLISCQIGADEIDKDNPIYGKYVVFTGALEKFKRSEAMQLVANLGGINQNGVTKATDYLVLGNNDYCATIKGGKSSKQKKAEEYMLKGTGIAIMDEKTFYDMVSAGDD